MYPSIAKLIGQADIIDEFAEHRRRFLLVVMMSGMACATVFLWSDVAGLNDLSVVQRSATSVFALLALFLSALLWRDGRFYTPVVWVYDLLTFCLFDSALVFMPHDEMRAIWFFLLIAGTFTLIGTRAGWLNLVVVFANMLLLQHAGLVHFSSNAIATFTICLFAVGAFFHAANRQVIRFVDRIRSTTRALEQASRTDALTGLSNNVAMAEAWSVLAGREESIAFLFLDIDHFKTINDNLGHAGGDIVLRTIAEAVRTTVGAGAVAGRIGGEEFAILLPGMTLDEAVKAAEAVRSAVEGARPMIDSVTVPVTASLGVAVSMAPHQPQGWVQRAADTALYEAKRLGRNRVVAAGAMAAELTAITP